MTANIVSARTGDPRATLAEPRDKPASDGEQVYVTLTLAGQLCGIPVASVRDVLAMHGITPIPLAPPEIAGSLNLRGRIVTAINLRRRLHLPPAADQSRPMAVVVEHAGELYALLVDEVSEVLTISENRFERNPATLRGAWAEHCVGIYRLPDRLLAVLDIARLLALGGERAAA